VEKIQNDRSKYAGEDLQKGFLEVESEDGKFRYKIGIIDFLTKFSNFKMLENEIKSKVHGVD